MSKLFVNPASGSYNADRISELTRAFAAAGADVTQSESSPSQAALIADSAELVCVVGGDGTIRHVAQALLAGRHTVPLCAYPGGTVNLMQQEVRWPTEPEQFVKLALDPARQRPHYPAQLNESLFLACASIGPDSAAVAALSEALKRWIGQLAYVVAFLGVLWRWPRPRLRACVDGQSRPCEAIFVAKGHHYAGPWSFAPAARMDAMGLHCVAMPQLTRWIFLKFIVYLLLGRSLQGRTGFDCFTCTELLIESDTALPVQADGDIACLTPVRIRSTEHSFDVVR